MKPHVFRQLLTVFLSGLLIFVAGFSSSQQFLPREVANTIQFQLVEDEVTASATHRINTSQLQKRFSEKRIFDHLPEVAQFPGAPQDSLQFGPIQAQEHSRPWTRGPPTQLV